MTSSHGRLKKFLTELNAFDMKKIAICLATFVATGVAAQPVTSGVTLSHYILDSFTTGTVLQKSGDRTTQPLNYNALTGEMIFDAGGKYLAIAEPQYVDTVYIGQRKFIPGDKKFYEVLINTPLPLLLEATCTVQEPGSNVGFGSSSNTTAATPLKNLISSGGALALQLPEGFKVKPGYNYWIVKDGYYRKANNAQQLGKIFPDKRSVLANWIKTEHTDFAKRDDVIKLVQQLQQ